MNNIVFKINGTIITSISKKFIFLESADICKSMTNRKLLNIKTFKALQNLSKVLEHASDESFFRIEQTEYMNCFNLISKLFKNSDFVCPSDDLYDKPYPTLCLSAADNFSRNLKFFYFFLSILILILPILVWRRSLKCTDENQRNESVN